MELTTFQIKLEAVIPLLDSEESHQAFDLGISSLLDDAYTSTFAACCELASPSDLESAKVKVRQLKEKLDSLRENDYITNFRISALTLEGILLLRDADIFIQTQSDVSPRQRCGVEKVLSDLRRMNCERGPIASLKGRMMDIIKERLLHSAPIRHP